MKSLPVHGRGASYDPPNRFTDLQVERDGWIDPDDPGPETVLHRDTSRSIIATNTSPDVGFEASVNPYRGCEHGCVYCLDPATPILMGDGRARAIARLRAGDVVFGTRKRGHERRLVRTLVLARWETRKPAYRVVLADGTDLVASGDHRFLTEGGWKFVTGDSRGRGRRPRLTLNDRLVGTGGFARPAPEEEDRRRVERLVRWPRIRGGLRVVAIEPVGERNLIDITTGTGDFIADGVVSHNCYARPTHEYFGLSPGLDFESRIFVKEDAPQLLRAALADPSWEPKTLVMSGVTDPYQPVERRLGITRGCLEVLAECRHPVAVITKNHLVTRDRDLLGELAGHGAAAVSLSVTTLRNELQRVMEPRTAVPARRLRAIRELADAGIPVGVMVAPVVPGLTEHEMPEILEAAAGAGATRAGYILLRLPHAVKELFQEWLEHHVPDRKRKVLNRLRSLRSGRLNDPRFGTRMSGEGPYAEQIRQLFEVTCRRLGLDADDRSLNAAAFRRPPIDGEQLALFG